MINNNLPKYVNGTGIEDGFDVNEAWIQTFSGRRFNPINPNYNSIVIQDIAHALSMQCRFSGHIKSFYSVAQHSVAVSYFCQPQDALWGLLHDASEAYLVDIPSPLKRSKNFEPYVELEKNMMLAVCKRFDLPEQEPSSVKFADKTCLLIEAENFMQPLHKDWIKDGVTPPFKLESLNASDAKKLFLKRFAYLTGQAEDAYINYY